MNLFSKKALSVGLLIGLGLVGLSYLWPTIHPVSSQWTEVEQKKLEKAGGEMHGLQFKVGHARRDMDPNADRLEAELRHWKEEYAKESKHLELIQNRSNLIVNIFYYAGIVIGAACTGALVYLRDEHGKKK